MYKSYILIDFFKVGDDIKDLFKNYKDNLDMLFTYLSTYFSTRLYPRESIIVFDEIDRYAGKYATKVNSIYEAIPAQLQLHDHKFQLADLDKNARFHNSPPLSSLICLFSSRVLCWRGASTKLPSIMVPSCKIRLFSSRLFVCWFGLIHCPF